MNVRRVAAIVACAAIAAVAVGCGGDDTTATTETLTKQEWITQADQICSDGDAAIEQAAQDAGLSNPTPEELKSFYTETVLPGIEDQRDQLEALPVPAGEEEAIGSITDALDQAISDSQADPEALVNGEDIFKDVNQQAQDYGLTSCGDGGG